MEARKIILWAIVALVIGAGLGFGFRDRIASFLNLEAKQASFS
ncbi:MAG: hypothetical protein NUV80_04695 [Candidatus Berkelbacteria bacterium]|nr:hypothetical protein [Candidatus Berkelbacteria bacterium]MCR4307838.1 hypothetical protein [Candidatus Berkelbacteria bacterium]